MPTLSPGHNPYGLALRQDDPESWLRTLYSVERWLAEAQIRYVLFNIPGAVSVQTYKPPYNPVFPAEIIGVRVNAGTAPSGGSADFDLHVDGTTVFTTSTKPTLAAGETVGVEATLDETDENAWDIDAKLEIVCDAANGVEDVVVAIQCRRLSSEARV